MDFAGRLTELMAESRLSNLKLAKAIGVSDRLVGAWKRGENGPTLQSAASIADFFDVSLDYLSGRSDVRSPETKKEPAPEISRNGLEMLEIYEILPEREQLLEIGRLQAIIEPMIGDLHRLKYYDAEVMDDIRKHQQEREGKTGRGPGGVSSGGKAV